MNGSLKFYGLVFLVPKVSKQKEKEKWGGEGEAAGHHSVDPREKGHSNWAQHVSFWEVIGKS